MTLDEATRDADRVQLRERRLAKTQAAQRSEIHAEADALILGLYRSAAPAGWLCGWCDATVQHGDGALRRAGAGVIILDARGNELARISRPIAGRQPFEAEIAALELALQAVAARARIRLYTDCKALVLLWLQHRRDPRLGGVRLLAGRLRRFEVRSVPRRHNRVAHRLARSALSLRDLH